MCGRYTLKMTDEEIIRRFEIEEAMSSVEPSDEIFPSQAISTVFETGGKRILDKMKWGFVAPFGAPKPLINVRAEGVARNGMFRLAFQSRRCIVPATGFFEWKAVEGQKRKQRIWFSPTSDDLFGFAGIWQTWTSTQDEAVSTVAVLTCAPNTLVADVHNRMPVILKRDDEKRWLSETAAPNDLERLLTPFAAEMMCSQPIEDASSPSFSF